MLSQEHDKIIHLIKRKGPCTGLEIMKEMDMDRVHVWKVCKTSRKLKVQVVGQRYLRLDRHVDGYARLSPSILREFLTYSVVGLENDHGALEKRCKEVLDRIHEISKFKYELAQRIISEIMHKFPNEEMEKYQICFVIAGDIVYDMAHDVPRPERSTGELVRGSDIDLVVVVDDNLPDQYIQKLDELIHKKKYRMLIDPNVLEELDYKIKKLEIIKRQSSFDGFKDMVAMKILWEGRLIHGSKDLFCLIKEIMQEKEIPEKLEQLENLAGKFRINAEKSLLNDSLDNGKDIHLFYSAEEFEEFD